MKQNKNSFSIFLACLSAIAAMSGCNWENEKYDKFVNPSLGYAIRCPGYCDTTYLTKNINNEKDCKQANGEWLNGSCQIEITKEECVEADGEWLHDSCYIASRLSCAKLTHTLTTQIEPSPYTPWYTRQGISLDNGIYMYKIFNTGKDPIYYCTTYEEMTNNGKDSRRECNTYKIEDLTLNKIKFDSHTDLIKYFEEMTNDNINNDGYSLCPANTLSCTSFYIRSTTDSNGFSDIGFCSSCDIGSAMKKVGEKYRCVALDCDENHYLDTTDNLCKPSNEMNCGIMEHACNDSNYPGFLAGRCEKNKCVATNCKETYIIDKGSCRLLTEEDCEKDEHLNSDGICEKDNEKKCGGDKPENNCTALSGWNGGNCVEGKCVASACETGYDLVDGKCEAKTSCTDPNTHYYNGECIDNDLGNCGNHAYACATNVTGWKTGECIEGKCVASSCDKGYDLVDGKCEAKTSCTDPNTHYYNGECIKNDLGNCGAHGYACAVNMTGWKEGECVTGECVASECVTGYDVVLGRCEAKTSCEDPDTHYYNGECIDNDLSNCGKHNNRCADITGWKDGKCDKGVCDPDDCVVGYHLDAEGKACVADDTYNCGSVGQKCGEGQVCTAGDCKDNCGSGEVRCEKDGTVSCADPKTSMMYCGANATCSSYDTCTDGKVCIDGKCKQTSCSGDTTLCVVGDENQCINLTTNNANHCGACNLKCSDQKVSHATSNACSAGKCQYTCDTNYKNCGSAEVPNCIAEANLQTDPNNCGNCGVKCNADEYCSAGGCKKSTCDSNQCLTEGTCANSDTRCGTQCIDCNTANNATSGTCSDSGECKITECMAGYHLASDNKTCVPNTRTACAPVNSSTTTDCTNSNHAEDGYCSTDGACYYTLCATGYHADEGKCVEDSETACGAAKVNCIALDGWKTGTCDSGVCKASTCDPDSYYCLSGTTCVDGRYNSLACGLDGGACGTCGTDEACSNGKCVQSNCDEGVCFYMSAMGASCQNDATHCGSECTNCNTANNAASGTCTESGECEITTCAAGYHRVTNASGKYACVLNTSNACGAVDATEAPIDCNNANNAASGVCNSDGSCTILSCTTGFHLDNTLRCVEDDENACGAHAIDCEAQDGWATANCDGGTCKPLTCDSGYHTTTDNKCVPDSPTACGSETNTCYSQGVKKAFCEDGECYIASCNDGYLVNNNESCELSCGGSICTTASIENSAAVECTENVCVVSACATDYHISSDNRTCEPNTVEACGSPTNTCSDPNNKCVNASCCRDNTTTTTTTKPENCCSGLSCWKKGSEYRCATSRPSNKWSGC